MENEDSAEKQKVISPTPRNEEVHAPNEKEDQEVETSSEKHIFPALENEEVNRPDIQNEDQGDISPAAGNVEVDPPVIHKEDQEMKTSIKEDISPAPENEEVDPPDVHKEDQEMETSSKKDISPAPETEEVDSPDVQKEDQEMETSTKKQISPAPENEDVDAPDVQKDDQEMETSSMKHISPAPENEDVDAPDVTKEDQDIEASSTKHLVNTEMEGVAIDNVKEGREKELSSEKNTYSPTQLSSPENSANNHTTEPDIQKEDQEKGNAIMKTTSTSTTEKEWDTIDFEKDDQEEEGSSQKVIVNSQSAKQMEIETVDVQKEDQVEASVETESWDIGNFSPEFDVENGVNDVKDEKGNSENSVSENPGKMTKNLAEFLYEEEEHVPQGSAWPEKAASITNFVKAKSVFAVSNLLRRLSGRSDDVQDVPDEENKDCNSNSTNIEDVNSSKETKVQEFSHKTVEKSGWNLLTLVGAAHDVDMENKAELKEEASESVQPLAIKGRILLYTRLGSQDCKEARLFLHRKGLRYIEVNIDVYPSRKLELEKIAGSSAVPKVFFNKVLIGGLNEIKDLDESGKLEEKIEYVINESPSFEAPLPPLSGEDDVSSSGGVDELAVIARKMKETIVIRDRFYKLRRVTNCFQGSEGVDFLSEDQYLERVEAVEFGRKLARNLLFQHVFEENIFEDGNHLYRFLDHDPVLSQCQNIPRGIIELKPKPITEISSRLRFLSYAILEAYASEDGKHVDYRSIHGSEEFARYLRIVEELQRVDLQDMPREEKLAFFLNLYNMMAIHAILVWGHPAGALDRRKLVGDFKYVIGGCPYTLSAIHNGILRGNQRAPYTLIKPFGVKDKRFKVALPSPEPLIHFALVCGNRSAPALRGYSPGNIDTELMEATHDFLSSGGLILDINAKTASVSKMLRWYSIDFGKNEAEVLKLAANYLEPTQSESLLELLASTQLKVVYQPYDWGLNS